VDELSVLIAGGGVAALEAALTLAEVAEGRTRVELLAAEPVFWYRPSSVAEPFGLGTVRHFDLGLLAARAGAAATIGTLTGVDVERRLARTASGTELGYDALLIACGATPTVAVRGALTFRGPADGPLLRSLVEELDRGEVAHVAFVVPWGSAWPLPAYELALMTARRAAAKDVRCTVSLVSPEPRPLDLFGRTASEAVREMLREAGVEFVGGVEAVEHVDGRLVLSEGDLRAERVVALPRLVGSRIEGLVQTSECFIPVDDHCCVLGADSVFAAGDITAFAIKQGGIAAQQAVAAAEAIAVLAGATLVPRPFTPILRGLLLTGADPAYLRRDLSGEEPDWASSTPIWWPPTKIVGRRLGPFLASFAGASDEAGEALPPPGGLAVDVPIARQPMDTLAVGLGF
jgi:sulfide:quinone oxidoreductase